MMRPPKGTPRVGTRVVYQPNPISHTMYTNPPRIGERGTVTTVPLGARRSHYLPGPGGGLLYVKWDHHGTMGVAPHDVQRVGKPRENGEIEWRRGGLEGSEKLISETNTKAADKKIQRAFTAFTKGYLKFPRNFETLFEHGQWWIRLPNGMIWSVVDAEPGIQGSGIDFELIEEGEEYR